MWNYRIVKQTQKGKYDDGEYWSNVSYAIHEVYYNKSGSIWAVTENPIKVVVDLDEEFETEQSCVDNVKTQLEMMQAAVAKEVVDLDTLVYADQDKDEEEEEDGILK